MRQRKILITLVLALCLAHTANAGPAFRLDGQPANVSTQPVLGDGTSAGDVIQLHGHSMVLRDAARYDFETQPESDSLWLNDGTKRQLVAVLVTAKRNPLESLSDGELAGLWGVRVDHWNDAVAAKLAKIDAKSTLVTFTTGEKKVLPKSAGTLSYLAVESSQAPPMAGLGALKGSEHLRYLDVKVYEGDGLNLGWLGANKQLRFLACNRIRLPFWSRPRFPQLHTIDLGFCLELTRIDFVREMPALNSLRINLTAVTDLSPIVSLPKLRKLNADGAPIAKLPAVTLPELQMLRLMMTRVADNHVAAFAKLNPHTIVFHRWQASLERAAQGVTKIRVRSGGTCHRRPAEEKLLAEVVNPEEIRGLFKLLVVDEAGSGFHCMCCGNPSIEFYAGDKLLLTLGYHHARSLRWSDWPGDAALTDASAAALVEWMTRQGVPGPAAEFKSQPNSAGQ